MVMEMASCARAFVTRTPCGQWPASISSQGSSSPNKPDHFFCCALERNAFRSASSSIMASTNPRFCLSSRNYVCHAVEGNSTSSGTTANAELPDEEAGADIVEVPAGNEEKESPPSQMRQERVVVSGVESPSKIEEFWRGVLEETRLIEWPSLQKVLGTTGVVTSIIVGASLVLLTVNALLAQLSDAVFKNAPPA